MLKDDQTNHSSYQCTIWLCTYVLPLLSFPLKLLWIHYMIKLTAFRSCCQEVKGGKLQCFMLLIESLITVFCSSDIFTLIILSHERKLRNYPHTSSLKSIVPSLSNQILNCSVMNFMHEIVMKYVRLSNNYCKSLAAIFGVAN